MQENLNICIKIIRMENYGRKIIDYIFGKRSNSSAVSYEREQKIQANSDRSDIRVFETGISPQRHGNIRQSSRAAEEEECNWFKLKQRVSVPISWYQCWSKATRFNFIQAITLSASSSESNFALGFLIGLSSIVKYSNCFRLTITPRKGVKVIVVSKGI
jgi:hypothetical protein